MATNIQVGDDVLCPRLGPGHHRVVSESGSEFVVVTPQNKKEHIFKIHCHTTVEMARSNARNRVNRRREAAASIGSPKIRPGKKK